MPGAPAIAIRGTGLVTSVGLSAPAACAAIRAKLTNPAETHFIDAAGERIMAHEVVLERPWRGRAKLARMAAMAIEECLAEQPREQWARIPLLLCVAERERPGRLDGIDDRLFGEIENVLDARFAQKDSAVIAHGRVGTAVALARARDLIHKGKHEQVLIAATDSLVRWPTLSAYERAERLLTTENSNGFIPGEGAGALLLAAPGGQDELRCAGVGFGVEQARIDSGQPLRAEGLSAAIKASLSDAGCALNKIDYRVTDLSGEHYYFKEAALALSRTLRDAKTEFELWHPAECIGEAGALSGVAMLASTDAACRKHYAPGHSILAHMANDAGQRAAAILHYGRGNA